MRIHPSGALGVPALFVAAGVLALSGSVIDAEAQRRRGPSARYVVRSDDALRELRVSTCFVGAAPPSLVPGTDRAADALVGARVVDGPSLPVSRGRVELSSLAEGACVELRIDVERALAAGRLSGRRGDDVLMSAGVFLWRDPRHAPRGGATVRFELPAGIEAATPWPRARIGDALYVDPSGFTRPSFVALGRLARLHLERAGVRVTAVRLGAASDRWSMDDEGVLAWLGAAVDGIASVQGRFPVDRLLVVLSPIGGRGMGFGMVRRGGGPSVYFQVGVDSTLDDLTGAWVTWHELSHLQLPALPQRDAWLYEGMATYYQEVVAARAGVKSPTEAWRQLTAGFRRGARSPGSRPLSEEAASMMRTGAFLRVYWAGAAFALEADVELRQRGSSLDAAIAHAAPGWRSSQRVWTSEEVCAAWDRPNDGGILRPLRAGYVDRRTFPGTHALLERLGVRRAGRRVALGTAELSELRDAIMR